MSRRFTFKPVAFRDACAFVEALHRHHKAPRGHRFSLAGYEGGRLFGVVIVGRPTARLTDAATCCEITRLCTDGTEHGCSYLYARARAATVALGYDRLITYTLPSEGGASLRAAGFTLEGQTRGGSWSRSDRPRSDNHPLEPKDRWAA